MGRKSGRKAINKLVKKIIDQNQKDGDVVSYIGCCEFGMETYASFKPIWWLMDVIIVFIILVGLFAGPIVLIIGILFGVGSHLALKKITNKAGIILYNDGYIKIIRKYGKESYTLSLDGLVSIERKRMQYIYTGQEGAVNTIGGGGKGFAAFMDYLHEFKPEMVERFIDDKLVYNCYMSDKNNMYI